MFRGTTWSSMHGRVGQTHWWWHETRWWYYWWYWWRAGVEAEKDQYWGAVNLVTLVFYKTDFVGKCMLSSFVFLIFFLFHLWRQVPFHVKLSAHQFSLLCNESTVSKISSVWLSRCLEDVQVTMIASDQRRRDYWHWSWPGYQCVVLIVTHTHHCQWLAIFSFSRW